MSSAVEPVPRSNRLAALFSLAVSLALLIAVAYQFRDLDVAKARALLPASPVFWLAFAGYYLAGPFSEWFVYRRLWAMPLNASPSRAITSFCASAARSRSAAASQNCSAYPDQEF